ncbi:hypothetical protein ACIHJG_21040 [Streptomyces sp. NPDC052415]|uniref:hypothetical protein n=1 Tax=Streptomyces sp. NPDC052415 TaxID=3365690 RepID=UPI0037CF9925
MNAFLTAAALVVLIAAGAYAIHRLNLQHADRIAVHRYSDPWPDRHGRRTPQPSGPDRSESPPTGERRDHREGGRGRFPPRRRSRSPHHK